MEKQYYTHYYKELTGKSRKTFRKLRKWLKKNPDFEGAITVERWRGVHKDSDDPDGLFIQITSEEKVV